jgi:hypothetical protein
MGFLGGSTWKGVSIGFDQTIFEPHPIWTRIDQSTNRISRIEIQRGRRDEFERTDTGTATIFVHDQEGLFDPTNVGSPYYGRLDSVPIAIAIRNPVTGVWFPLFRGCVDEYGYDLHPSQKTTETAISCVDAFDYLAGFELAPGLAGDLPPTGYERYVFYEDTAGLVQDRLFQAAGDARWPSSMVSFFTGNVHMQESTYSPGESILTVMQDCADAEFPTVANLYVDAEGFLCFHGRFARFTPDTVAASASHWDFRRFKAGDGAAILADPTRAQLRPPFTWSRSRKAIRNAALCYPQGILDKFMPNQIKLAQTSIDRHGLRMWSAENLWILSGETTGNTGREECELFAEYVIDNYANPADRVDGATFRSLEPSDPRAPATWDLICDVDISDVVDLAIGHPGGGGFASEFFVEGLTYELTPLRGDLETGFPNVDLRLDLSPAVYWGSSPF